MSDVKENLVQQTLENLNHLKDSIPQAIQSFSDLSKAALQDGKFDKRTKEIIALAIAIATYSKGCIKFHLQSLSKQDLSQDELMEIIAIITYMCGGSGLISATKALKYFEEMRRPAGKTSQVDKDKNDMNGKEVHNNGASFRDNTIKGYD